MKNDLKSVLLFVVLSAFSFNSFAQLVPYKNSSLPTEVRVADLVARMTLEEKFWQLFLIPGDLSIGKEKFTHGIFGLQVSTVGSDKDVTQQLLNYKSTSFTSSIAQLHKLNEMQKFFIEETRLGIPAIFIDEALHGLIREGCTSFPQAIGMAASWNPNLMYQVSDAMADECRMRGVRDILSPVINIANDVRWGRTEETYGECPFLTSAMAVAFVYPFEQKGIVTTPKHFLANVGEGGRDSYPIFWSEWYLRQTHLLPFEACFKIGGSRSVMSSYNSINGTACSQNSWLLRDILKNDFEFKGFVLSDAGAVGGANVLHFTAQDYAESTAQAINGGLDVIFQTSYDHYTLFKEAFDKGMIDPNAMDDAVSRVLTVKFDLGLFDNPYIDVPQIDTVTNSPKHRALCEQMAEESFVLLKNENQILPLQNIKSIALIGFDADTARLGGYSGPGAQKISILRGITERFPQNIKINFAKGVEHIENEQHQLIAKEFFPTGLKAEYFANLNFEGSPAFTRDEAQINGSWTLFSPDQNLLPYDNYSIRWQGDLVVPATGTYQIGFEGNDGYRLYINDQLVIDQFFKASYKTVTVPFSFKKGVKYQIKVEYFETAGNAKFKMVWNYGIDLKKREQMIQEAVKTAKNSDVAVVVVGIHEGEFQDRAFLSLPGDQEKLILAIAATGKPLVVLMVGGSAITMENWKDQADAIMMLWYPGDEGGYAVADVLLGKVNPSGKLPITFPIHEAQLPLTYNHIPTGRGDDYYNLTGQPLFPFGYGLSYTSFQYSDIKISNTTITKEGKTTVSFTLTNTGKYDGAEVVQLYVKDIIASVAQPIIALKGFQKVFLKSGESKKISFEITPQELKILNAQNQWVVEPGEFRIMIGTSSKELRLKTNIWVTP